MMRIFTLFVLLTFGTALCQAQTAQADRVEGMKIAYLTKEMNLSAEDAQIFWPVYNAFQAELKELKKGQRPNKKPHEMTEAEMRKFMDEKFDREEQVLALKKTYHQKFLSILSAQQVFALYRAEVDFRKRMVKELAKRRTDRPMRGR